MGNANEGGESSDSGNKKKLPFFTREEDDYNPLGEDNELSKNLKCSMKTRVIGFAVCCGVGWLFSILGTISLVIKHNIVLFAIMYSIGQILNITGYIY